MVLKSKKSNSKRTTLRHKYKVIKKVKQHLKKKDKEAKKAQKAGKKPRGPKDPGLPAQWPFKDNLIADLKWQQQRILAQEKDRKLQNRLKRAAESEVDADDVDMKAPRSNAQLQEKALEKQAAFLTQKKARLISPSAAHDKDGSRRTFFKEFVKVVTAADVIIEVLDARDPLGSRCLDMERFVRRAGSDKRIILLLNKIDLVPREVAEAWLKYLREEMPTVAFKSSTQKQSINLKHSKLPKFKRGSQYKDKRILSSAPMGSDCLGAETLLQLLKNYARNADIKTAITVGVVGLPNVGKSSLINSLKRARVAAVGNTPGVTRTAQEISLDKYINLLDSPGIAFSPEGTPGDAWSALRNCVKVEALEDPEAAVAEILKRCPGKQLISLYKLSPFSSCSDFLQQLAFRRGRLLRGGVGDSKSAACTVLHDWHNGKICYYTMPPKRPQAAQESQIVASWGQEFDADKVFAHESTAVIADLPSLENAKFIETSSAGPGQVGLDMLKASTDTSDDDIHGAFPKDIGMADSGRDSESEDDEGSDEEVENSIDKASAKPQASVLYSANGQFNPQIARNEKKKQKREKKVKFGEEFNFAEAFAGEVNLEDDDSDDEGDEVMV